MAVDISGEGGHDARRDADHPNGGDVLPTGGLLSTRKRAVLLAE
jgi:hypothetical protein